MPQVLAGTVMIQEQLGFALNRGAREEAAEILTSLIDKRRPGQRDYGLLGRVYKDRWEAAAKAGQPIAAQASSTKAIGAIKRVSKPTGGCFPGINVVTLMEIREPRIRGWRSCPSSPCLRKEDRRHQGRLLGLRQPTRARNPRPDQSKAS